MNKNGAKTVHKQHDEKPSSLPVEVREGFRVFNQIKRTLPFYRLTIQSEQLELRSQQRLQSLLVQSLG